MSDVSSILLIKIGIDCYDQTIGVDGHNQASCLMTEVTGKINLRPAMTIVE